MAETSEKEVPTASFEERPAGADSAPDSNVIEIEDEPEEPEGEVPSVQKATKRKGKEKVQWSTKRTRFASDPREYALTRANEAELVFGRPRFVLPTAPVTKEIPAMSSLPDYDTLAVPPTGEPADRSPIAEAEACSESGAGLILGDQMLVQPETLLSPRNAMGTQDHMETETVMT